MSHLDRLATPIQPKLDLHFDFDCDQKRQQSLIWAGQVSWNMFMDHSLGDDGTFGVSNLLTNVKAIQIAATSKGLVGLTKDGKLFQLGYNSEQKQNLTFANLDFNFTLIQASLNGNSLIGISANNNMIVHWEFNHEHVTLDQPFDVLRLREPLDIVKVRRFLTFYVLNMFLFKKRRVLHTTIDFEVDIILTWRI